jgi:surface carbohydrate biosynthesis protein
MNIINKVIYLPVQIKKRAFIAKLLLGYLSLQYNYSFVIGRRFAVKKIALNGPDGVYLEKDFFGKKSEYFEKFKNRKMKFYGLDDEGLVFHDDNEYINRRVDYDSIKFMEKVFAWGQRQANILKNFLKDKNEIDKVMIVGNPRVDVLRGPGPYIYSDEIEKIKNRYKNFVLFNSFFALANGIRPFDLQLKRLKKMKKNITDNIINYWSNFYEYQKKLFVLVVEALRCLANDPSLNIVIRPHPNEKELAWKSAFKNFKNVHVSKEFDIFPWIYLADIVIHNSCTTGIEAYLLGKNVIAYKPISSVEFDLELPNKLSVEINDFESLKKAIYDMLNKKFEENDENVVNKKKIINYNLYLGNKLSSELIIKEFNKNCIDSNCETVKSNYLDLTRNWFLKTFNYLNKWINLPIKNPYIINDFPITSCKEVDHYLKCMNDYFKFNFRYDIKEVASSCFFIKKI